ncbi:hypothetical protein RHMOL_Rhmol09G0173700 [Rhododendron molle]|uniref:Uncharacterized protein n=1 Tax=Rhododendron molle TaxID=49168 RepID=A0ACC0MFP6_RHOML|nr:hypothetical protein RHMOL_Rhmol09G0173700 [Rhododendron molle]
MAVSKQKQLALLVLIYVFLTDASANAQYNVKLAPALYVFGDSTVDGGNRLPPNGAYGMDLNSTVRPRWSNGLNIADFLANFLGLPFVPPYSNMSVAGGSTTGVNYGSAGCGILPQTGQLIHENGNCWSFDQQIVYFNRTVFDNLTTLFNNEDLIKHLRDSVFLISFGINDYGFNYLRPTYNGSLAKLEPEVFAKYVLNELSFRLTILHWLGGRKFVVNNIWPMGCTPCFSISQPGGDSCCDEKINQLVIPYNNSLPQMLMKLEATLPGFLFTAWDDFQFILDLKMNTAQYGITHITGSCLSNTYWAEPCRDRSQYLYYDSVHTTQAADFIYALNCFNGTLCSPRNVFKLVGM